MRGFLPRPQQRAVRPLVAISAAGLAGLCGVGLLSPAAIGLSAAEPPIRQQVDDAADDLAQANDKVNKVADELARAQRELDTAQQALDDAQLREAEARETVLRAQVAVANAQAAVEDIKGRIGVVQQRIASVRSQIAAMARFAYTSGGNFEELQIVLESRDPAEFAERLAALGRISRANDRVLDQVTDLRTQLNADMSEAAELQGRLAARQQEAAAKSAQAVVATTQADKAKVLVQQLVDRRKTILHKADSERDAVREQYDSLREEQRKIREQIKAAIAKQKQDEARRRKQAAKKRRPGKSPNTGSVDTPTRPASRPGKLSWPMPGYDAGGRTGPRIHPVYGYYSCHTGDDIGAPYGTAIRAAADGYVISTDSGGPYGNHTLISHGGVLSTMYAHQSSFAVSPGEHVRRGQVIGYVGSTGYSTGPHLHFEVHVDGVPWEPMGWFGESKHRVSCA